MKKKLAALAAVGAILLSAAAVLAKGPPVKCTTIQSGELLASNGDPLTTGFDEFGYNYQAHQYIGYYGNYQRPPDPVDFGYRLMMKWNDAWLSNQDCDDDYLLDRHYDFNTYIGSGAWLTNHQSGEYMSDWSLIGDWVLEFDWGGSKYLHDMSITDDTFTGTGAYPSGGLTTITWIVTGTVTGDDVAFTINYDGSSYFVDAVGTIAADGSMSGIWSNPTQSGNWKSISGTASNEECSFNYFVKIVAAPADAYADGGFWYTAEGIEIGEIIWGSFAVIQEVETDSCLGLHGLQYNSPASPGFGFYKP